MITLLVKRTILAMIHRQLEFRINWKKAQLYGDLSNDFLVPRFLPERNGVVDCKLLLQSQKPDRGALMPRENHGVTVGAMAALARSVTPEDTANNPHLAYEHAKLQAYVDEIQQLTLERAALQARKQEATERIREIRARGSQQATLVETLLKVQHGPRSEQLVAYHIKPFRGRKRRRPAEEPAEASAAPASPGAPAAGEP
jgi:hypothetical protein